jgi:hypothetical protein
MSGDAQISHRALCALPSVYEYVIAYAPEKTPLRVLAVFHGRRSPRVIAAILRGRE